MSKNSARRPKVSVMSISYNQERFITQALEGFIMQQTDFLFEVVISDDASTDGTAKIISAYAKKYPDVIKPILREKNIGAPENFVKTLNKLNGEYVAICEGDDFWTDPHKLQKQVDFLNSHPGYSLCFHPVKVFFEDDEKKETIYPETSSTKDFTLKNLLRRNFIQTNSVMYRKKNYNHIPTNILPLDWYLHLYHAQSGKIGFINEVMSVYRKHEGGLWWGSSENADELYRKHGLKHMELYGALYDLFPDKASRLIIQRNVNSLFDTLLHVDERQGSSLVESALRLHPQLAYGYIQFLNESLDATNRKLIEQEKHRVKEVEILRSELDSRGDELRRIKSSRVWKLREGVVSIRKRGK